MVGMGRAAVVHRPGVIVVDEIRVGLVNLDRGEVVEVEPDLAAILSRPELASSGDPVNVEPVSVAARAPSTALVEGSEVVVNGPLALRIDNGRLLAWDMHQSSHVELDQEHLVILERAHDL